MFECKHCIEKQKQIDYLQKLVDKLLVANGVAPVSEPPPEDMDTPVEKLEQKKEFAHFEYGGD
jgi:hypothetical protein